MRSSVLGTIVAVVAITQASTASAGGKRDLNSLLKGQYRFTANQLCTYSDFGFDLPAGRVLGRANTGEDHISGVATFNGDGTVSSTDKGIFQTHDPFLNTNSFPPFATYQDSCKGTYQVNPDLSFQSEISCTVTLLTGANAGHTIEISGIKSEGQLDQWRSSYVLWRVKDSVQTLNFSFGFALPRICGATEQGIRIPTR